jgi:hypothetical protein
VVTLVVEGAEGISYSVELTPPAGPVSGNNDLNPDPVYAGRQSMAKGGFAAQAKVLGDWRLKIQRAGAADFKSLSPEDIRNAYLVLGFKTS